MKDDGGAEFELEMLLKDSSSKIFLFKVRIFLNLLSLFNKPCCSQHRYNQIGIGLKIKIGSFYSNVVFLKYKISYVNV